MHFPPAPWHWFFMNEGPHVRNPKWIPLTKKESAKVEKVYLKIKNGPVPHRATYVHIDRGAVVNLTNRTLIESMKPDAKVFQVKRCLYFVDSVPVDEEESFVLEDAFRKIIRIKRKRAEKAKMLVHNGTTYRRGPGHIEERFDHLMFVVHGIGDFANISLTPTPPFLRFSRATEEAHNLEKLAAQMMRMHFPTACTDHRIKVVPIVWRDVLHNKTVQGGLNLLTLPKIPKLRHFVINETGLDVLFYTAPAFQRKIGERCVQQMNEYFERYSSEMPTFKGQVSVTGHSLGCLVLYDILKNQKQWKNDDEDEAPPKNRAQHHEIDSEFPQLSFQVDAFWALGSPVGIFETLRGNNPLGKDFRLPTCTRFYNIFHPNDPVAYRCEPLMNPAFSAKPFEIPRHNGIRYFHTRVRRRLKKLKQIFGVGNSQRTYNPKETTHDCCPPTNEIDERMKSNVGYLITGHRVDFMIQENFIDHFKPYVTSLTSHLMYWKSKDLMKMMLKETYPFLKDPVKASCA